MEGRTVYMGAKEGTHGIKMTILSLRTHLDICALLKAVHLRQQLHQDALYFSISTCLCIKTCRSNGIHLH